MSNKKLNCQAPQCGYWREETGCSINDAADNGREICEKGEGRYGCQIFVVVEGGLVTGVCSDNPDVSVEVLDIDNASQDTENENALDETRQRIEEINELYYPVY